MENNRSGHRKQRSLVWPAAILATGGALGLWLWLAREVSLQWLLAPAVLILAAAFGIFWQSRARAARRRRAALDAYAEREISRARRGNAPKRLVTLSTRGRVASAAH
jgi:hypothetical protein